MGPLTEPWVDEVTAVIAKEADLPDPITDRARTVQLTVGFPNEPDRAMCLHIDVDRVVLRLGVADRSDAVLSCSVETMARLCRREITAGEAFRAGLVTLTGDIDELTGLDEVFDEVVWAMGQVDCEWTDVTA